MGIEGNGRAELRALAARLKEAGTEGQGLRRELLRRLDEAARPLADEITSAGNLRRHMPHRYADVLAADLKVTISRRLAGSSPRVAIEVRGRLHKRKLVQREDGILWHPVYAQGLRKTWNWSKRPQAIRPGFVNDPVQASGPAIREAALKAVEETMRKVAGG